MRVGKTFAVLILGLFMAVSVAGCLGESVTITGQGVGGTKTAKLDCLDSRGDLSVAGQSAGSFTVSVHDAEGVRKYHETYSGQQSDSQKIAGTPGEWTLTVENSGAAQFSVTLSC